jgi:hypothetical protein
LRRERHNGCLRSWCSRRSECQRMRWFGARDSAARVAARLADDHFSHIPERLVGANRYDVDPPTSAGAAESHLMQWPTPGTTTERTTRGDFNPCGGEYFREGLAILNGRLLRRDFETLTRVRSPHTQIPRPAAGSGQAGFSYPQSEESSADA